MCIHAFHRTDSTDTDIYVLTGEYWRQKHTQHEPSMKTECDYLYQSMIGIQPVTYVKNLSLSLSHTHTQMVNSRATAGNAGAEEEALTETNPYSSSGGSPCWVGVLAGWESLLGGSPCWERCVTLTLTPLLCLFVCL